MTTYDWNSAPLPPFVRRTDGRLHGEIDLDELARTLRDAPFRGEVRTRIVGPHDLHVFEQRRRQRIVRSAAAIPADYFVFASGEAPHRAMTKLGGVPFLPASMPWPRRRGTVGDFYAQLSFVDSKDLLPSLPGDVLLVFRFHDLPDVTSRQDELYGFVWVDSSERRLIAPADVQRSQTCADGDTWATMHGYRVRTFDDPSQLELLRAKQIDDVSLLTGEATKVGGAPNDCQSIWPPTVPNDYRFLGQLTAVFPAVGVPFPVVDREAPLGSRDFAERERLCSGPGSGITCLYLDSRGDARVFFSEG
jgi:hypothetical protein